MTPDLDERLDAVPALADRRRTVEELSGGLTNLNLKVSTAEGVYVVRVFQGDAALLGIDRDAEEHNTRAAAQAGVAPRVVDYRPDLEMLVIDYISGVTYDNGTFAQPGVVERVADAFRTLHRGPRFVGDFDMFVRQAGYLRTVREKGWWLPDGYDAYDAAFHQVRAALEVRREPTVPCNNDLLAGNLVDDGTKLWLIDYEYSGNNDACFELGNTSTECDLDIDQIESLVNTYYGRPLRNKLARVRLQALVSAYGWSLWGAIQSSRSSLDFDFRDYAVQRFHKAVAGFTGPDFDRLLQDVRRDD
ncbi:phosphotransferase family protein [soil metagenome]